MNIKIFDTKNIKNDKFKLLDTIPFESHTMSIKTISSGSNTSSKERIENFINIITNVIDGYINTPEVDILAVLTLEYYCNDKDIAYIPILRSYTDDLMKRETSLFDSPILYNVYQGYKVEYANNFTFVKDIIRLICNNISFKIMIGNPNDIENSTTLYSTIDKNQDHQYINDITSEHADYIDNELHSTSTYIDSIKSI